MREEKNKPEHRQNMKSKWAVEILICEKNEHQYTLDTHIHMG